MTDGRDGAAIATAIIRMGHSLRMEVIAEGVETPEQLEILRSLDCDVVQGFLLGRPGAPDLIGSGRRRQDEAAVPSLADESAH